MINMENLDSSFDLENKIESNNFLLNELSFENSLVESIESIPPIEERYHGPRDPRNRPNCEDSRSHPINPINYSNWMYRPVCYLRIKFGDKYYRGTGFKVSDKLILTSAHCLYDARNGQKKYADSIEIFQSMYDYNKTPYGKIVSTRFLKSTRYNSEFSPHDIGGIIIPNEGLNSPNFKLWFRNSIKSDDDLLTKDKSLQHIMRIGYPSDKTNEGMTFSKNNKTREDSERIYYNGTQVGGASGSPTFFRMPWGGPDGTFYVNGIVSGHYLETCECYATKTNPYVHEIAMWLQISFNLK